MVVVSYSGKEINAKLVYYGPGLSGKTTNLEFIYDSVPSTHRGKMVSMKTRTERTLFFDFLPVDLGEMGGFKTRFLLYTVPGQVYYNATRKLVLRGVDAVVFVADSGRGKMNENIESLENLHENLREYGINLNEIPWVLQYNKRDLPDVYSVEELNQALNPGGVPAFEAVATDGTGVFDTFKGISKLLLEKLSREIKTSSRPAVAPVVMPAAAAPSAVEGAPLHPAGPAAAPPETPSTIRPLTLRPTSRPLSGPTAGLREPAGPVSRPGAAVPTASLSTGPPPAPVAPTPSGEDAGLGASSKATLGQRIARLFGKAREEAPQVARPLEPLPPVHVEPAGEPPVSAPQPPRQVAAVGTTRLARVDLGEAARSQGHPIIEKRVRVPVPVRLTPEGARNGVTLKLVVEIEVTAQDAEAEKTGTE